MTRVFACLVAAAPALAQHGVHIDPRCPSPVDPFVIEAYGIEGTACVPDRAHVTARGDEIDVVAENPACSGGAVENTPWSVPTSVGPLSAGAYGVYLTVILGGWTALQRQLVGHVTVGAGCPTCPADCDSNGLLDVADLGCFLWAFAYGWADKANCDGSTVEPILNVADFACFLNAFAAGCS
jgi:hypothetical protein